MRNTLTVCLFSSAMSGLLSGLPLFAVGVEAAELGYRKRVVARTGQEAPGIEGAVFVDFRPLGLNDNG